MLTNLSDRGRWFQRTDAALTKRLLPPVVRTVLGSRIAFCGVDPDLHDLCIPQVCP